MEIDLKKAIAGLWDEVRSLFNSKSGARLWSVKTCLKQPCPC
ncbi:MAG: hypothetical protein NW214_05455 [Pseudanabaenaceae cyanobacterium bins.39]|nr:hypothetical protein [Pseudanabaenaceae cyanobacterium bins.39]